VSLKPLLISAAIAAAVLYAYNNVQFVNKTLGPKA
jgi:hypothetical protein